MDECIDDRHHTYTQDQGQKIAYIFSGKQQPGHQYVKIEVDQHELAWEKEQHEYVKIQLVNAIQAVEQQHQKQVIGYPEKDMVKPTSFQ